MRRGHGRAILSAGLVAAGAVVPAPTSAARQAQSPNEERARGVPAMTAVHRAGEITIDGVIAEPAWQAAAPASGFVQRHPLEGAPARHDTEVRILFDEHAMYVAARLHDDEPGTIVRQLVRRDESGQYDYFEFAFDPNLDRRSGYIFRVSAANVQRDGYLYGDNEQDYAWDGVWASAVHHDSLGWSLEARIPLSQMRYQASQQEQTWGVNFARVRIRTNEETHYALVSRLQDGVVSQFATLGGIRIAQAARRLELRPYVLGRAHTGPAEAGDPFRDGSDLAARTGLDVRYGLGAQFTLDATFNPDFGQVEADPAVINLTAFETFFQERRPFFVEDAQIFDFSLSGHANRLFYSRRIGRSPSGRTPASADFAELPEAATILGAAKLTGRTSGGLSLGALAALTQAESGLAYTSATRETRSFLVEPRAGHGVVRVEQDFNDGASTIGAMGTAMVRGLPDDASFDFLPRAAFGAGVDWEHQWGDREWAFFGYVAGSHTRGDSTAMIRIQRASNHYFQRPDARWVSLDSTATSMTGVDWRMTFERRRGTHWTGAVWAAQVTPGFEINDLGFSSRQEVLDGGARIAYREIQPGRTLRSYNATFFTFHNWSHDALDDPWSASSWGRAHVSGSFNLRGEVEFLNYWSVEATTSYRPELSDRTATRGGPLMLNPRSFQGSVSFETDQRRPLSFNPFVQANRGATGSGSGWAVGVGIEFRPSPRVAIEFDPEFGVSTLGAQYVTTSRALSYAPTAGARYLFGELERRELSLETRLDVTFSPKLSFQLFAQPLLSAGDYTAWKQLIAPETYAFDVLQEGSHARIGGLDRCVGGRTCVDPQNRRLLDFDGDGTVDDSFANRDFNVRSLIGNAVLRWEYRPGSTVFVVWQRRQIDEALTGRFDLTRDLDALLGAPAENIFMIKLNYWIGL